MMALSASDKQFIDDNMLTDEDFYFDDEGVFELSYEDRSILECITSELKNGNEYILPDQNQDSGELQTVNLCENLDELLKDYGYDVEMKLEPSSPYSPEILPNVPSSENNVSVITIPEVTANSLENGILSDTPPHTPPGLVDLLPDSPSSCTRLEPVVVSLSSFPNMSYSMPLTTQTAVKSLKPGVKIKPKPESTDVKNKVTIPHFISSSGNKAILTPDQLVKLAKGTLKAPNVAIPVPSELRSPKNTTNGVDFKSQLKNNEKNGLVHNSVIEVCAAALKRQQRILKNRLSADLSRKRKKEYVQKLEAELNLINAENSSLREENCRLRLRISDLEKEVFKLKSAFSPKAVKKTACLMVVLFMLTFNLRSYSPIFDKTSSQLIQEDLENHRIGRILLWNEENSSKAENSPKPLFHSQRFIKNEDNSEYIVNWDKSYNTSTCQQFINKTESLRLEKDLLGWVKRVEKKQKQKESKQKKSVAYLKEASRPLVKLQPWSKRRNEHQRDVWAKRKNGNEILIYQTPRQAYEDFFDAIHRRDDSFYFVSFSGDHLLLPAIAHNQTLRPRMSFVMPAMTWNDSVESSDDHISMMQIDCEVMDTKLVYIKESVIPAHLRQKQNSTSKSRSKTDSEYAINKNTKRLQETVLKLSRQPPGKG